jgi:hypothetical protein
MLQFAVELRNARLDAIETAIGPSAILRIASGAPPASLTAADPAPVLAEMTLPADYLSDAANGSKSLAGIWSTSGLVDGVAGHFRILTAGDAARIQGTVGETGADMIIDNATIKVGQTVAVRTFTLTDANA